MLYGQGLVTTLLILGSIGGVAGFDGDDFVNNLITDLTPLLSLFGERVTTDFMSQAISLADCLLIALAPLGILTIIVSAIRVGGPSWLKSIIGRGRENLSVAEIELMSSTSEESCELWNGRNVVRCPGSAPVWQFICVIPDSLRSDDSSKMPRVLEKIFSKLKRIFRSTRQSAPGDTPASGELPIPEAASVPVDKKYTCHVKIAKRGEMSTVDKIDPETLLDTVKRLLDSTHDKKNNTSSTPDDVDDLEDVRKFDSQQRKATTDLERGEGICSAQHEGAHQVPPTSSGRVVAKVESRQRNNELFSATGSSQTVDIPEITVIRNLDSISPNLSFNCHGEASLGELYFAAALGTIIQLGVLVFFGVITHYTPMEPKFRKDERPVASYAFPFAAGGTLVLAAGLFLCACVIERSTQETYYRARKGTKLQVIWLQQSKIVGDQVFKPFSIYPREYRNFITTSRRRVKNGKDEDQSLGLETVTTIGTLTALIGFFFQFTGLRSLHWTASAMQLGAVIFLTALRAWLRRRYSQHPESTQLTENFELDWFALSLHNFYQAPWATSNGTDIQQESQSCSKIAERWYITSGFDRPDYEPLDECEPNAPGRGPLEAQRALQLRTNLLGLVDWQGPAYLLAVQLATCIEAIADALLDSYFTPEAFAWTLPVRYRSKDGTVAIKLTRKSRKWKVDARVIEAALSLWLYSVLQERCESRHHGHILLEPTENGPDSGLGREAGSENMNVHGEDDSMFRSKGRLEVGLRLFGSSAKSRLVLLQDLQWWMPEQIPKILQLGTSRFSRQMEVSSSRIVGFGQLPEALTESYDKNATSCTNKLRIDINIAEGFYLREQSLDEFVPQETTLALSSVSDAMDSINGASQIAGEPSDLTRKRRRHWQQLPAQPLAVKCYDTLEKLYARDLLFSFIRGVAMQLGMGKYLYNSPTSTLRRQTGDKKANDQDWRLLKLQNDALSEIAQKVESTGFASSTEIYFDLVMALSAERKLPYSNVIVDRAQEQGQKYEIAHKWTELSELCSNLLSFAITLDPEENPIYPRAVAVCSEYLQRLDAARTVSEIQCGAAAELEKEVHNLSQKILGALEIPAHAGHYRALFKFQGQRWNQDLLEKALGRSEPEDGKDYEFPESFNITTSHVWMMDQGGHGYSIDYSTIWSQDAFDWHPLHYAAALRYPDKIKTTLSEFRCDTNVKDLWGCTPLHYACLQGNHTAVQILLDGDANVHVIGSNGFTPMHCAAKGGNPEVVKELKLRSPKQYSDRAIGALSSWNPETKKSRGRFPPGRDIHGRAPIHLAAIGGHLEIVKLLKASVHAKDRHSWTPLHFAIQYNHVDMVKYLVEDRRADKEPICPILGGMTLLHLAVRNGHAESARILLKNGAFVDGEDGRELTPLHTAAARRQKEIMKLLLENDASPEARCALGRTPLHYAASASAAVNLKGPVSNLKDIIECLLKIHPKLDLDAQDERGFTPLDHAVKTKDVEAVKDLWDKGATLRTEDVKKSLEGKMLQEMTETDVLDILINWMRRQSEDIYLP